MVCFASRCFRLLGRVKYLPMVAEKEGNLNVFPRPCMVN